jgi:hypothetical protein
MANTKLTPSVRCRDCQKLAINGRDFRCLETSMQIPQAEVNDRMYCTYFDKKDRKAMRDED